MYAVIKVGGKQYRVEQGQKLLVDRQPVEQGKSFTPEVLMTGGEKVVTDLAALKGTVTAEVVEHLRGEKLKIFTFKPKRGFKKTRGHRSELSRIQIQTIGAAAAKKPRARKKPETAAKEASDGAEKGTRLFKERPRLERPAPGREGVRGPGRNRRSDHRAPARDALLPRHRGEPGWRRHGVRDGRRHGRIYPPQG
jgi:large subunit ribosomal protein L21